MDEKVIYDSVQSHYSSSSKSTRAAYHQSVARAFGYSGHELAETPEEANLGLSCGNPVAIAKLKQGETVIDLGSGAGFDVFLAAKKVGPSGAVYGVDMNEDMLARANRNKANSATPVTNVQFLLSHITSVDALGPGIADCIISNCVINLVPERNKHLVFNEMFRLLKPGGRVAVSDILAKKPLPEELKSDVALYVGCIAGASLVTEYEEYLSRAGFRDIVVIDSCYDLNAYKENSEDTNACCGCGPSKKVGERNGGDVSQGSRLKASNDLDFNEWAGSFKIYAVK